MNRHWINLTGIALFIFLPGLLAAADPLWDRVMNHTTPENTDQALAMNMVSNEKNRDGEITKTTEMLFTWDTGTENFLLVSAMENGKDVTERERRRAERRDENDRGIYAHQMFNPEKSAGLSLDPRDISAIINGRECRIYDFRFSVGSSFWASEGRRQSQESLRRCPGSVPNAGKI